MCAGLHHAHERTDGGGRPLGIVHRDISPSNVLVGFEGAVKLTDFGIAKATQAASAEPGTNTLRGKMSYLSPEQCLGLPLDRRADLYALSVVLYELTTGARPHGEAPSEFLALKQTLEAPVRRPSTLRPGYPEELERIVLRGLHRDREQRWATARELQLALEAFARQRQLAVSAVTVARLMEELFAGDLEAWHAAQSRGTPLHDHVTKSRTLSIDEAGESTTQRWRQAAATVPMTLAPPPFVDGSRRGRRMVAAVVAVATAASLAVVLAARHASRATPPATPAVATVVPRASAKPPSPVTATMTSSAPPTPAPPLTAPPLTAPPPPTSATSRAPTRPAPRAQKPRPRAHPAKRAPSRWDPEAPVLPH